MDTVSSVTLFYALEVADSYG